MISTENKNAIKVFVDTNVILDALTQRDVNYQSSLSFMRYIIAGEIRGYMCSKQITDLYYILKKYTLNDLQRRNLIKTVLKTFELLPLLKGDILATINTNMKDFEDAILDEVAKVNMIPYFVTNNIDDYKDSKSMVLTPDQFLTLFQLNK